MNLAEAAARADELAQSGAERELADLRSEWADELERSAPLERALLKPRERHQVTDGERQEDQQYNMGTHRTTIYLDRRPLNLPSSVWVRSEVQLAAAAIGYVRVQLRR